MKHLLLLLLLPLFLSESRANEKPYFIDLSKDRSFERVKESGIPLKKLPWSKDEDYYSAGKQYVTWRLPGGGEFTLHSDLCTMKVKNGKVRSFSCNGEAMPMEEAYALGKMLCETFNFPVEKLEKWHALETGPGSHQIPFPFGILNSEPHVDFTIKSSINELYPWMIILNGAWGLFPDRDATQTRLPFLQPLQLSLDPPSGRRYDRADAWKDVLEAHAADPGFDERWAAQYPEEAKRLRDLRNPPPKIPPAAPAAVLSKPETAPSGHLLWWVCLLLVTALFGWHVRGVWKSRR